MSVLVGNLWLLTSLLPVGNSYTSTIQYLPILDVCIERGLAFLSQAPVPVISTTAAPPPERAVARGGRHGIPTGLCREIIWQRRLSLAGPTSGPEPSDFLACGLQPKTGAVGRCTASAKRLLRLVASGGRNERLRFQCFCIGLPHRGQTLECSSRIVFSPLLGSRRHPRKPRSTSVTVTTIGIGHSST